MGPLASVRIIEFAGIGPAPMAAMMFADLGATVLRIERPTAVEAGIRRPLAFQLTMRGRKAIALDLKNSAHVELALKIIGSADGLIEGFRPGVMERLGLGPDICLARNPTLVYGRMTGWGQTGPLAQVAAHDLNYIALTGALHAIGRKGQPPTPPLNLLGDLGGGATYLAFGMASAMLHARQTGEGQIVDAAIVDGVAHLMTNAHGLLAAGVTTEARGENIADSGAFHYDSYQCSDGEWISIAPLEDRFYGRFMDVIGLARSDLPPPDDRARWDEGKLKLAKLFRTKSRAEWVELLEGTDACFAPVLKVSEAPDHPHMQSRGIYADIGGITQPLPAPRFSRTVPATPTPPAGASLATDAEALAGWLAPDEIARFIAAR